MDLGASISAAEALGGSACGLAVDVRDRDSFANLLAKAESNLGPLYALVNNAGVLRTGPFIEASPDSVRLQVEVNLGGVLTGTQLALERLLPRGEGHVVDIARDERLGVGSAAGDRAAIRARKEASAALAMGRPALRRQAGIDAREVHGHAAFRAHARCRPGHPDRRPAATRSGW